MEKNIWKFILFLVKNKTNHNYKKKKLNFKNSNIEITVILKLKKNLEFNLI